MRPLQDLPAVRPVAEVRERDDHLAPDAQHLGDDLLGVAHRLQRLRQDHAVERRVVEAGEPALEVALQHVDAVAHARRARPRRRSRCRSRCTSRSRARYASRLPSPQPRSSTLRARRIQLGDRREVGALRLPLALLDLPLRPRRRSGTSSSPASGRDVVEVRAHERVVLRVVEQERVVAVRRVDLRVATRRAGGRPAPSRSRASAPAGSASRS